MLPALDYRPSPQSNQIDQLKDQLDFAARDIQEERRERMRMREQLSIQNEIINKLYTRLNQLEEEQAESTKVVNSILQSSLLQHQIDTRKQEKLDKNATSDVEKMKEKFKTFSTTIRGETEEIKTQTNDTNTSLHNIQEYLTALHQSDQSNGGRITTLESNTTAAMECIKSLQSATGRLQSKIASVNSLSTEREQEVASSLQGMTNIMSEAKAERGQLQQMINNSSLNQTQLKQSLDDKLQKNRQENELQIEKKYLKLSQSVDELKQYYHNIDLKISDDIALSFQDTRILISSLQASIVKEKSVRLEWEQKLRRDTANVLNNLRQNLREQMSKYISVYEENQTKVDASVKQLYKSIGLIEQSGETTKQGLEHILQAEIKTRCTKFKELEEHLNTVRSALGALDNRREEDIKRVQDQLLSDIEEFRRSTSEELKSISDSVTGIQDFNKEQIEKTGQDIIARVQTTEEQLAKEIRETQEQIEVVAEAIVDDRARKLEEALHLFRLESESLQQDLLAECQNRKDDLSTINAEIAVKQDKLSHEADLNTLRSDIAASTTNVYEVEEKMTVIEATSEEAMKRLTEDVDVLYKQIPEITESIKQQKPDIQKLANEIDDIKEQVRELQTSGKQSGNLAPKSETPEPPQPTPEPPQPSVPPNDSPEKQTETLIPEQL